MYNYSSRTQKYINKEIDARLGEITAQGLVRSEEEYRKLIQEMVNSAELDAGRITNPVKYVVTPDEVVSSILLNDLFKDLEADLRVLHGELRDARKILDMSLVRNKVFYRRIKTKLASIWKEISQYRESSFNTESADYTFFESFDSDESAMVLSGLTIDKKTGIIHLTPASVKTHNEQRDIQEVSVSIYPPENKDGGVYNTTNPANKIDLNYATGDRQMMKNGLWKVQVLAAAVPENVLDPLRRNSTSIYTGLVASVDIVFAGQKTINELALDPYGEFETKIIGVLYKKTLTGPWAAVTTTDNDAVVTPVMANSSDWMHIRNIDTINAKALRIILHQESHVVLSKLLSKVDNMVDKMVTDLRENRYKKLNYKYKYSDAMPRVSDVDKNQGTLYDEVMDSLEEGGTLEQLEKKVGDLLIPKPLEIDQDIQNWKVYNTGAWSVEPKTVIYPPSAAGIYLSHDLRDKDSGFRLDAGAATEATLYTKQTEPQSTLIEWYLVADNGTDKATEIPIIPNNDLYRTEIVSYGTYYPLSNTASATTYRTNVTMRNTDKLIKLDFPIHPNYLGEVSIYENGTEIVNENSTMVDVRGKLIESYNSTELYLSGVELKAGSHIYAIKYIPALLDTVKVWTITPSKDPDPGYIDLGTAMVFTNERLATAMAQLLPKVDLHVAKAPSHVTKAESYDVKLRLCTKQEYDDWFLGGRVAFFVDACVDNDDVPLIGWMKDMSVGMEHHSTVTKLTWLYEGTYPIKPYSDDSLDKDTWAHLPSAPPALSVKDKQYGY